MLSHLNTPKTAAIFGAVVAALINLAATAATTSSVAGPSSNQIYEPVASADQTTLYKTVASSEPEYVSQEYSGQSYGGSQAGYGGGGYQKEGYKEEKYPHQPYGFGYNVDDGYGNKQWRHEKSQNPHAVSGTYGYKDKNGILREVNYVADEKGFRAMIKTTEPGTAPKDPSYVKMDANPIAVEYYPPSKKGGSSGYGKPATYAGGEGELYADSGSGGNGGGVGHAGTGETGASGYVSGNGSGGGSGSDQYLESKNNIKFSSADSLAGYAGNSGSKITMAKYQDKK